MDKNIFPEILVDLYGLSVAEFTLYQFDSSFKKVIKSYSSLSSDEVIEIFDSVFKESKDQISKSKDQISKRINNLL